MAITYKNQVGPLKGLENIPVLIIAADRPKYLLRCIHHLLISNGVSKENIVVSIDGSYSETEAVATLFGIRSFQSKSEGTKSARVSRHYRRALEHVMNELYPQAPSLIILEDDLQVAPDFFYYFEHLLPLLDDDEIYCISAWNDHGMEHAVHSPEAVYRIEGMPGLGWATSRKIIHELLPKWLPKDRFTDWDIWMRQPAQRRGRQCLIPDISRTFHFGEDGLNVNSKMQGLYFRNHAIFNEHQKAGKIQYRSLEKLASSVYDDDLKITLNASKVILPSDFECAPGLKKVPFFSKLSNSQDELASFILYYKQGILKMNLQALFYYRRFEKRFG
jgi:beta-1,2-N-acetylglucosaminyltransferase